MKRKSFQYFLILLAVISQFSAWANVNAVGTEDEMPYGEPIRLEYLLLIALGAFLLFKLFGLGSKPAPPPAPKPKSKPLMQQVAETIGGMEEVGKDTYVGSKLMGDRNDVQTYLMMAQIDRKAVRKEERARAEANYAAYQRRIFYWRLVSIVMVVAFLAIFHETLIGWFISAKDFISSFI